MEDDHGIWRCRILNIRLVAIAEGFHAYPYRTRPLSLPAPMVLGPKGPRVGGRQADTYSLIAQLVEHSTVNRVVTGSSPVRGATYGEVSELAEEHDWKSCRRQKRLEGSNLSLRQQGLHIWPVGQEVKTPPFTEVTGFESPTGHHFLNCIKG